MVMSCSAYGCTNRHSAEKKIQFHRFPLDNPELLKKWVMALRREPWKPTKSSRICSDHFTADSYKSDAKRYLNHDAVPSIFDFPVHLKKSVKTRRVIIKHKLPNDSNHTRKRLKTPNDATCSNENNDLNTQNNAVPGPSDMPISKVPNAENDATCYKANNDLNTQNRAVPGPSHMHFSQVPNTENDATCSRANNELQNICQPVIPSMPSSPPLNTLDTNILSNDACAAKKVFVSRVNLKKASPTKDQLRRKIRALQAKLRRRDKKIKDLDTLITHAKKIGTMSEEAGNVLQGTFGTIPCELIFNELKNSKVKPQAQRYSSIMKEFALTLYFYSPRSYNFLRKKIILPHPASIRSWVSSYDCNPGFLDEAFIYLSKISADATRFSDCALIVDAMSIRKQVVWDKSRNRYCGYVECAGIADGKEECLASEALAFIVVSLSERYKCPVAYFLIDKINADVLAELINTCITKLFAINLRVWSVTADGLPTNINAFQNLGCRISGCTTVADFQTYFVHDSANLPVYAILDPCHMLKLARNTLADRKILTSDMGTIKWQYLQDLHEVQNEIGLKFANKISGAHINFKNKKMNVSLAAQTLSSGAADALQFLLETKNAKFLGAEGTINFIRIIDRIFDLCNSRSPYGKGFKSPLALRNCSWWENIFEETLGYLANLKLDNIPILQSPRKTFALGFIVTIKSISLIAKEILSRESNPFKYFLTYKVSQDHIELFFNNIRACGGFNNNPNACQFRWAMRKMLLSRNVSSKNSNCLSNDYEMPSSILEFRSEKRTKVDGISEDDCFLLSAYSDFLDSECLSNYQKNILCYMGGYIVKNLVKKCTCIECINMLTYENNFHDYCKPTVENPHCFVNVVSRGGLKLCSPTVFNIVCAAEKAFKFLVVKEKHNANVNREILFVTNEYLDSQGIKFFHPIENELGWEDLHETQMTKKIIESFVKIRIRSYEKVLTNEINKNSATVRQKLTKLILFNNV